MIFPFAYSNSKQFVFDPISKVSIYRDFIRGKEDRFPYGTNQESTNWTLDAYYYVAFLGLAYGDEHLIGRRFTMRLWCVLWKKSIYESRLSPIGNDIYKCVVACFIKQVIRRPYRLTKLLYAFLSNNTTLMRTARSQNEISMNWDHPHTGEMVVKISCFFIFFTYLRNDM